MSRDDVLDDFLDAADAASAQAASDHLTGICQLSRWSCSYCEQDASVVSERIES